MRLAAWCHLEEAGSDDRPRLRAQRRSSIRALTPAAQSFAVFQKPLMKFGSAVIALPDAMAKDVMPAVDFRTFDSVLPRSSPRRSDA